MVPELVHFNVFDSLHSFFDARDIVVKTLESRPNSFLVHQEKSSEHGNILIDSLMDCFYDDSRDGRETSPYYAVVEADKILANAFHFLNDAKKSFKKTLTQTSLLDPNSSSEIIRHLKNPSYWPRRLERYAPNLGRLNINHVYRCYYVSSSRPYKAQQSWSTKSKSIKRISKKDALDKILGFGYPLPDHLEIQYRSLASLPDHTSLAVVKNETPCIKTNLFFESNSNPVTLKSKLPIIIPIGSKDLFVQFMRRKNKSISRKRTERSDVLIDKTPVASSIHVYKYRDAYEQK